MPNKLKILVVEPDVLYGRLAKSILKTKFNVQIVQSPFDAMDICMHDNIDIFITDYNLPGGNGLQLIKRVLQNNPHLETIMTGQDTPPAIIEEALKLGAIDFFNKPFSYESVQLSVERTKKFVALKKLLKKAELDKEILTRDIAQQRDELNLVSVSKEMDYVKKMMGKVAQSNDTSVIITGESGVGKELVARGIHSLSERKTNYFGAINMSAISDALFESEFFGHKKGSFTGAITDRAGWFEVADKGTLFLDEIGDMPANLQIKLLRVLEDRKYIKVGSQTEKKFDVRIIAATNKNINYLKNGNDFRIDLYHRIGTFEIFIPPLRERKDDIPVLLDFFMRSFAEKMRKRIKKINAGTLKQIQQYSFPGNIRELKNIIERAVILSDDEILNDEHFPNIVSNEGKLDNLENTFDLEKIEKAVILKALKKVNYNKSQAAKLLNINWNKLHRRLTKHKIPLP